MFGNIIRKNWKCTSLKPTLSLSTRQKQTYRFLFRFSWTRQKWLSQTERDVLPYLWLGFHQSEWQTRLARPPWSLCARPSSCVHVLSSAGEGQTYWACTGETLVLSRCTSATVLSNVRFYLVYNVCLIFKLPCIWAVLEERASLCNLGGDSPIPEGR